ncbi:hypothetical protein [Prescottella agglutinans]|uniref:Uncharacterized protein n=1 Tax=Prescottella agglutinans TaxID=1644129 RepID=A0ABT6M5S8_9NOCA|nr:hypothetical protein [Prescottella agglutinans]MDH6279673.1 hypothetical protein [Prescottella agglutinans]
MLVMTLVLAAVGFALLVAALMTGSVVWAWGCIAICVAGAVLLLVSALASRKAAPAADSTGAAPERETGNQSFGNGRDVESDPGDSGWNSTQG